jgi:ribosome-binding factor A
MPGREYPRTARLNQLIQEIVAEELERIDDDRLGFFTVVAVDVDNDLNKAIIWYTSLADESDELAEALEEHRRPLKSAIARQTRLKKTPDLEFRPDEVTRNADRIETILREISDD